MTTRHISDDTVWCIAHRGARDEAPENTRAAFERALTYPIDGIELDVQMSADGLPVIYHDRTLYRVTGRRQRVATLTRDQLAQIDWGRWYGPEYAGTPILPLEQVLTEVAPRTRLLIEIKSRPVDQASGHTLDLTDAVVALLHGHRSGLSPEGIHILSFDPQVLIRAHGQAPQWRCVLNFEGKTPSYILKANPQLAGILWAICINISRLSLDFTQWAKNHGLRVFTYTCNGTRQVKKALDLKVDAILSDRPGWLSRHLHQIAL